MIDLKLYREARKACVPAQLAKRMAKIYPAPIHPFAYGVDTFTDDETGVTYTRKVESDGLDIMDRDDDLTRLNSRDDIPKDAFIVYQGGRNEYTFIVEADQVRSWYGPGLPQSAYEWLFERYASAMRDVIKYGYQWVRVVATDEDGNELAEASCGGYDDADYGTQEMFEECKRAALRELEGRADYIGRL